MMLAVAGKRRVVYLAALLTGLRRSELKSLRWSDVHLDAPNPFIDVPASVTKNNQRAIRWLRDDLVAALRPLRPCVGDQSGHMVFADGVPTMEAFRADLASAGIAESDDRGRRVDFHALRHTLATNCARAGVGARITMEMMRHSDMRLTMKTYTDAMALPMMDALDRLPRFDVKMRSQSLVANGPAVSHDVAVGVDLESLQLPVASGHSRDLSRPVACGHGYEESAV